MIDFHCHILPGIDDGSRNVDESMRMIHEQVAQGVDSIVFTPHFYAHKDSVGHFLTRRSDSFQTLHSEISNTPIQLHTFLGAEVYYFAGIGRAEMIPSLCIEGTNILLLEMPFVQWKQDVLADVKQLLKRDFVVVLAHIERYVQFQKDMQVMEEILKLPVILQMNAGGLTAPVPWTDFAGKRKQKFCIRRLEEDREILMGTDAHNMETRRPNLLAGRTWVSEKIGQECLARIDAVGERLLGV